MCDTHGNLCFPVNFSASCLQSKPKQCRKEFRVHSFEQARLTETAAGLSGQLQLAVQLDWDDGIAQSCPGLQQEARPCHRTAGGA